MSAESLQLLSILTAPVDLNDPKCKSQVYQLQDLMLHYTEARGIISSIEKDPTSSLLVSFIETYLHNRTASLHVAQGVLSWQRAHSDPDNLPMGHNVYRRLNAECLQRKTSFQDLEIEFIWHYTGKSYLREDGDEDDDEEQQQDEDEDQEQLSSQRPRWKLSRVQLVTNQNDECYWKLWSPTPELAELEFSNPSTASSTVSSASVSRVESSASISLLNATPQRRRIPKISISEDSKRLIRQLKSNTSEVYGPVKLEENVQVGWNHLFKDMGDTNPEVELGEDGYWDGYDE